MPMRAFVYLAVTGGLLWVLGVACQQPEGGVAQHAPGELPRRDAGLIQPKIDASTHFAHGNLLERQGDLERAAEQYRRAIELSPDFVAARNRLGITLNKLGEHAEATEQFSLALDRQPNEAYLYNNLGFSLYLERRFGEAEQVLARALDLRSDFPRARMNHALSLAKLGQYEQAFEEFRMVGSEEDALYNIALIHTEAGEYVEAVECLDRALELNPALECARTQLHLVARLAAEEEAAATPPVAAETAGDAGLMNAADMQAEDTTTCDAPAQPEMLTGETPATELGPDEHATDAEAATWLDPRLRDPAAPFFSPFALGEFRELDFDWAWSQRTGVTVTRPWLTPGTAGTSGLPWEAGAPMPHLDQ